MNTNQFLCVGYVMSVHRVMFLGSGAVCTHYYYDYALCGVRACVRVRVCGCVRKFVCVCYSCTSCYVYPKSPHLRGVHHVMATRHMLLLPTVLFASPITSTQHMLSVYIKLDVYTHRDLSVPRNIIYSLKKHTR